MRRERVCVETTVKKKSNVFLGMVSNICVLCNVEIDER